LTDQHPVGDQIVGYGTVPRLFATRVVNAYSEGGGFYTFTLAVADVRRRQLSSAPNPEDLVHAVVATLTLSQQAINELVGSANNLVTAGAALKAEKPTAGAN
jgi:hypothetical protein